jgi:hypothetical protein
MSLIKFHAAIYEALPTAHFSALLDGRIYAFDSRYNMEVPDREQIGTFMGVVLLSGVFIIADTYPFADRLTTKLRGARVNCRIEPVEPPKPFYEQIN